MFCFTVWQDEKGGCAEYQGGCAIVERLLWLVFRLG